MNKFWLVWVEGTSGGHHKRHDSLESAKAEAERLAQIPGNYGCNVFVLELAACCRATNAIWVFPGTTTMS